MWKYQGLISITNHYDPVGDFNNEHRDKRTNQQDRAQDETSAQLHLLTFQYAQALGRAAEGQERYMEKAPVQVKVLKVTGFYFLFVLLFETGFL